MSNVTDMTEMFNGAENLTEKNKTNICKWNVKPSKNVENLVTNNNNNNKNNLEASLNSFDLTRA